MSEQNTTCVGEQTGSTQTAAEGNTEGCDAEPSAMQQAAEHGAKKQLYYKYEELHSKPYITPDSEIPENLLHLSHSFGYDSGRRGNLQLLDDRTLIFIAGNLLVLLDVSTKEQRYLRSCSGGGIGSITTHPSKECFVVAEKGNRPNIIVYEYPSLRPLSILRGGTERAYSAVDFNSDGSLLASVGSAPDYMLTLWDWRREELVLSSKTFSPDVYRVNFSPHNPGLLTSSGCGHIKFWKMADTLTGPKLQGLMGSFGKTASTDIEGCVELPDGKVVSGTDWGNLLLWDGNDIKVEICRKEGRNCHAGTARPFVLEDGQLMTIGSDGAIRGWDFESIDTADSNTDSGRFELEPINEMVVGHHACLCSVVKSSVPDSFVWFAQDTRGAIWKLDLSFSYTAPDPVCLFSFHAGPIQALDVSRKSHLMATTALDRSVKVFDFLAKRVLTTYRFNQGGTALSWAPPSVSQSGSLLVTGFEDGVVRLLELYNPQRLQSVIGCSTKGDATLHLKQAFKPHNAPVTAVAYERNGEILATGSSDNTVFFFKVGDEYTPIGFVRVPGQVQALEWSPHSHSENRLLILCQSGHVVEVHSPDPEAQRSTKTFHLPELPSRAFRFKSIKSRIKREEEIARRQAVKEEKDKEREEMLKQSKQPVPEPEEEEEELPPLYIPVTPSPLHCGFYSQAGQFWLSMGGFDSGFLYHCKFSEEQDQDPDQRQDEPFDFLAIHDTDDDPIRSVTFSSDRQLLLCGMHSGFIRVYPLQPDDHSLTSLQAYWALSVHDNQYGHLRHIRCSHDDCFVLTVGDDGNIFSFSLAPLEEIQKSLQRRRAKVPSPRVGLESEDEAQDIEDPAAYSVETAKQKLVEDRLRGEAQLKRKELAELQKKYKQLLDINQSLPEHVRLKPEELRLDRFYEEVERVKAQRIMEVRKQMAWEEERCSIALRKLQEGFKDIPAAVVTVVAICSDHRVSTYRLQALSEPSSYLKHQRSPSGSDVDEAEAAECRTSRAEAIKDGSTGEGMESACVSVTPVKERPDLCPEEEVLHPPEDEVLPPPKDEVLPPPEDEVLPPPVVRPRIKLPDRVEQKLRRAEKKAEQARIRIAKRKQECAQFYAEKSKEDPQIMQAIREAKENIGDLKLKSDKDYTVPKHLRMNTEKKRAQLMALEENIRQKKTEMNGQIMALRDSKVRLVAQLKAQAQQVLKVQQHLAAHLHRPLPALPTILPEETPEKRLQFSRATLQRYRLLREERFQSEEQEEQEGVTSLLEQLEKEMEGEEGKPEEEGEERGEDGAPSLLASLILVEEEEGVELTELEEELRKTQEIRLLYEQDSLLEQMENSVCEFDATLMLLRHQKLRLDMQLKMADVHQLTLFQELLLLKEFESRDFDLQEKLDEHVGEESSITSQLEEYNKELKLKRGDIAKLQQKEKALTTTFQASLGKEKTYAEFLTKVFKKKKIDRVKRTEEGGAALVCPPGCKPELFENTLRLRERRLQLEELLAEEKESAEALKKECESLVKKEQTVKSRRKAAEDDFELVNREKQQKMNDLDVVVPLRLHQIEFVTNGAMPSDLSSALLLDKKELTRLQEHVKQVENPSGKKNHQVREKRREERIRLTQELKAMKANIPALEKHCKKLMMERFGRLISMEEWETLQTLPGNRRLEELKQEKLLREHARSKELIQWAAKVEEAREALIKVNMRHVELLTSKTNLIDETRELNRKLNAQQKKMAKMGGSYLADRGRASLADQEAIRKLKKLVKERKQENEDLRSRIDFLSRKGGHVLPDVLQPLPPIRDPGPQLGETVQESPGAARQEGQGGGNSVLRVLGRTVKKKK